jgi:hypothetical protein
MKTSSIGSKGPLTPEGGKERQEIEDSRTPIYKNNKGRELKCSANIFSDRASRRVGIKKLKVAVQFIINKLNVLNLNQNKLPFLRKGLGIGQKS